ncbi:hypothetical protein THIOKS11320106 [Thiocapsa sp. KS1]|nr:hypothetical protein THIOKS11320106 [Thiocapsa sp. KS1]
MQLLQALILALLVPDVSSDRHFIPPHRRDKLAACPKMLAAIVALSLTIDPCQMDGALALDVPDHFGDGVLGRNRHQHVHMVGHQMALFDPTFLVSRELVEHLPQMCPQLPVQHFPTAFRDKNNVIFTLPLGVTSAVKVVHRDSPQACAWRLTLRSVPDGLPEMSNCYGHPGSAGEFLMIV